MTRTSKLLLIPVLLVLACFFALAGRHRFIDGDEGFYLLAARLVLQHKQPYQDFLYTQAPLLPYVYALWIKLAGVNWYAARDFSALLTTILGLLMYIHVCRETRKWSSGLAAVALFISSTYIFAWFPIVKTFSLAVLLLFIPYFILADLSPGTSRWLIAVAGLSFGLAVETRSYLVALIPVFLWWIFYRSTNGKRIVSMMWFLIGFAVSLAPSLYLFASAPDLYLFNNLGYHSLRSSAGLIGGWRWKLQIALQVLIYPRDNGLQFSLLAVVSFVVIVVLRRQRGAALLSFLIALFIGIVSMLPTPPLVQYFCMCVPFLIVAAVCSVSDYLASVPVQFKSATAGVCLVLLAGFAASAVPSFWRYCVTGYHVMGVKDPEDAHNWTLDKVTEVSREIDQLARPKEEVGSFWPGYIFASKANPYPGYENDFGWMITAKLTDDQRARYHILSRLDMEAGFAGHAPRIVVVGNQEFFDGAPRVSACAAILRYYHYASVRTIGDTSIFECCTRR